jgi:hypothetical protein
LILIYLHAVGRLQSLLKCCGEEEKFEKKKREMEEAIIV